MFPAKTESIIYKNEYKEIEFITSIFFYKVIKRVRVLLTSTHSCIFFNNDPLFPLHVGIKNYLIKILPKNSKSRHF